MISPDDLALEVQVPSEDYPIELAANPSGEAGTSGWLSPVAGSAITSTDTTGGAADHGIAGRKLIYTAAGGVANYLTSTALPMQPGQWVAAGWEVPYLDGYYRARFEFLDSGRSVISSSTQTTSQRAGGAALAPAQAPVGTRYVRLRFDLLSGPTSGNPAAGDDLIWRNVTIGVGTSSAQVGAVTGTNMVNNPSAEVNVDDWFGVTRSTAQARYGAASFATSGSSAGGWGSSSLNPVVAGTSYRLHMALRPGTTARTATLSIEWLNNLAAVISTSTGTQAETAAAWVDADLVATAPVGAVAARFNVQYLAAAVGEVHYLDGVYFGREAEWTTYFDANFAPDLVARDFYVWTNNNVPNRARSQRVHLAPYNSPTAWVDILGPTHEIKTFREPLNLGTLTATILDSVLDPAAGDTTLQPGRPIRLRVHVAGTWENLFTGKILKPEATYVPTTRITLTAVDNNGPLQQAPRTKGVTAIDDLPYVLEDTGVDWLVNGSSDQVTTATVASNNNAATALDQVAMTRDQNLGYAWVNRDGVLIANDRDQMPTDPVLELDEYIYGPDLQISFDPDDCMNSLQIITINTAGEVQQAGRFTDQDSIDAWGYHPAKFTIHAATTPEIAALAAEILAASADPRLTVRGVTIPVLDLAGDLDGGDVDVDEFWGEEVDGGDPDTTSYPRSIDGGTP